MSRRPSRLYHDQLLRLGNGYPLYEPDPGPEEPVQVGDVGYINSRTGHLHRAFNVLHEKSAPINQKRGVPDLFELLPPNLRETLILGALPPGVHTSSLEYSHGVNLGVDRYLIHTHILKFAANNSEILNIVVLQSLQARVFNYLVKPSKEQPSSLNVKLTA